MCVSERSSSWRGLRTLMVGKINKAWVQQIMWHRQWWESSGYNRDINNCSIHWVTPILHLSENKKVKRQLVWDKSFPDQVAKIFLSAYEFEIDTNPWGASPNNLWGSCQKRKGPHTTSAQIDHFLAKLSYLISFHSMKPLPSLSSNLKAFCKCISRSSDFRNFCI